MTTRHGMASVLSATEGRGKGIGRALRGFEGVVAPLGDGDVEHGQVEGVLQHERSAAVGVHAPNLDLAHVPPRLLMSRAYRRRHSSVRRVSTLKKGLYPGPDQEVYASGSDRRDRVGARR